ncbi:rfaE bifunctional protein, domain II [Lachnospiraceae bacterium NE2001]|nr:rfaE bifunctional protein, domain II [Lachnospiraceae bacterium NE2001]
MEGKIVSAEDFSIIRNKLSEDGKVVVMCHGVYDLLHYGHLAHLKEAKGYGDVLVVSVTSEPFVNKGPDRPYFDDRQRTEFLASIEYVDYVMLSNESTAITNIRSVKPDIFVKGQEFQSGKDGITGQIEFEIEEVERLGGTVRYTHGEVYSSSKLLNNYFGALPDGVPELSQSLLKKYGEDLFGQITEMVDRFADLKVLIVGDIIIDEYIFCQPQGLVSKDTAISTRFQKAEEYLGGTLAVARHAANFTPQVEVLSMMGQDEDLRQRIEDQMSQNVALHILTDESFVTPIKRRYLKVHPQRKDNEKLFSINYLNEEDNIADIDYEKFYTALNDLLPKFDLVLVCDYGHGLIDEKAIDIISEKSVFLSLNCQTNSSNYGKNVITKYKNADAFTIDERELQLAFCNYRESVPVLLKKLTRMLHSKTGWLTVGAKGAICCNSEERMVDVPALTLKVTDTVGAGDAFFALASLAAASGVPEDLATLLSNAAGAIKTHIVGNKSSIKKKDLMKFIKNILTV